MCQLNVIGAVKREERQGFELDVTLDELERLDKFALQPSPLNVD